LGISVGRELSLILVAAPVKGFPETVNVDFHSGVLNEVISDHVELVR
jgi:hypothetical protein